MVYSLKAIKEHSIKLQTHLCSEAEPSDREPRGVPGEDLRGPGEWTRGRGEGEGQSRGEGEGRT